MHKAAKFWLLACFALSACAGGGLTPPPPPSSAASTLELNPTPIDLTSNAPAAVITAQNDVAGLNYTAHADPSCTGATGSIAVAGDGVAQLDVAGAPLMFIVVATGTPPSSCNLTVTGSDGSVATDQIDYTAITLITDAMNRAQTQSISVSSGAFSPGSVTISNATSVVTVNASGFNGLTKSSVSCTGMTGGRGVSVLPSSFTGSGTIDIAPYGQGALRGSCTVTFTDSTSIKTTLTVTLAAPALAKLTVTPSDVQFACAGSSPQTCSTKNVTISESGATQFRINNRPTLVYSCANDFNGPLKMVTGDNTYATSVAGPQATVSFYGLLLTSTLPATCTRIFIGDGGAQTVAVRVNANIVAGGTAATAPSCTGPAPLAPVPNAPHGIYIWNPYKEGGVESEIQKYVLGNGTTALDPDICGASIVVNWSEVQTGTTKGTPDWSQVDTWIKPYAKAGLRVNLLFAASSEECPAGSSATQSCTNAALPSWIFSVDNVPQIQCPDQPTYPEWPNTTFVKEWEGFIDSAVARFSTGGPDQYTANIGYMRFGIGAGVEAYPGHIESLGTSPAPCLAAWAAVTPPAFSESAWQAYSLEIVRHLAQEQTDKQLMVSLNYVSTYDPSNTNDTYIYSDAVAAVAAPSGVAMGVQNLGVYAGGKPVAGKNTAPKACDPTKQYVNIYWCQPYMRHAGVVPFEFQPIESPVNDEDDYDITIAHLFQYGLDNNAQIFEIYPQDVVFKDDPSQYPSFTGATQADYQAAFDATSLILGRNH